MTRPLRASLRIARDFPQSRVMLPGSIAHDNACRNAAILGRKGPWASRSTTRRDAVYRDDPHISVAWLKAYLPRLPPSPGSREHWQPFSSPKFAGVLGVVGEDGVTLYRVPAHPSLARNSRSRARNRRRPTRPLQRRSDDPAHPRPPSDGGIASHPSRPHRPKPDDLDSSVLSPGWRQRLIIAPSPYIATPSVVWLYPTARYRHRRHALRRRLNRLCRWLSAIALLAATILLVRGAVR